MDAPSAPCAALTYSEYAMRPLELMMNWVVLFRNIRFLGVAVVMAACMFPLHLPAQTQEAEIDIYGGILVPVHKPTGYFGITKVGDRWTFFTPEGNAFWMTSVYHGTEGFLDKDVIAGKYAGSIELWTTNRNRRLQGWGFNTLGEYTEQRGLPTGTWGGTKGNKVKLPFIIMINAIMDGYNVPSRLKLQDGLKNIVAGVPTSVYNGWRGRVIDVFDPHLAAAYDAKIAFYQRGYTGGFADNPWVLGITIDDADLLFAIKAGGQGRVNKYPHPAFLIATAKFQYGAAEHPQGLGYSDPRLHSKYAWVDFLKAKYGTIEALNKAWGSSYTTFDDSGGYGAGSGVLDEDGRHRAWLGKDVYNLTDTKPTVRADLDAFLYEFCKHYAGTAVAAIRKVDKNHLIFGPAAINSWGAKARDVVLRGLSDGGIDVFCLNYDPNNPDMTEDNLTYDLTGKPAFIWYGVTANQDSPLRSQKPVYAAPDVPTQQERGAAYRRDVSNFFFARGANGDHYVVGLNWWELVDNPREHTDWGLVTQKDNAYDGKEATRQRGTDPWGYRTGGEERDYGDFLSTVTATNAQVRKWLAERLSAQPKTKTKR